MKYVTGDLLEVREGILVHGCNAQGRMGSGVALLVKEQYPECYKKYREDLKSGMEAGEVSWYPCRGKSKDLLIASAITQWFYGREPGIRYVSYDALDHCLFTVFEEACLSRSRVSMPKIGFGTGGGTWPIIEALIEHNAEKADLKSSRITIYSL